MRISVVGVEPHSGEGHVEGTFTNHVDAVAFLKESTLYKEETAIQVDMEDGEEPIFYGNIPDYLIACVPEEIRYRVDIIAEVISTPERGEVREAILLLSRAGFQLGVTACYFNEEDRLNTESFQSQEVRVSNG